MVLMVETVRNIMNERVLVADTASYSTTSITDWTSVKSYSVTVAADRLVGVKADITGIESNGGTNVSGFRVVVDGVPYLVKQLTFSNLLVSSNCGILLWLTAGAHTIDFQISQFKHTGAGTMTSTVKNIYIGTFDIADDTTSTGDSGIYTPTYQSDDTVLTLTLNVAAARTTPVGDIRKYTAFVTVYAYDTANRYVQFVDAGASNPASKHAVKVFLNDVQDSWTESQGDTFYDTSTNSTYALGGRGIYAVPLNAGSSNTVKIRFYNNVAAGRNVRVYATVTLCPWLCGGTSNAQLAQPVDLSFPQGSTLYVICEPLFLNPSKAVYIGYPRGISFGASDDYFSSTTGADRLSPNYTFDLLDPANCLLLLGGLGGCLTCIAVDARNVS